MVYYAIETTCFGIYWPSSGFYNVKEEFINAVKNCEGVLIKFFTAFIDPSLILSKPDDGQ